MKKKPYRPGRQLVWMVKRKNNTELLTMYGPDADSCRRQYAVWGPDIIESIDLAEDQHHVTEEMREYHQGEPEKPARRGRVLDTAPGRPGNALLAENGQRSFTLENPVL